MSTSTKPWARPPGEKPSSSDSPARLDLTSLLIGALCIVLVGSVAYYLWPRDTYQAKLDEQIEEGWMAGREVVDALEFFEKRGVYESRPGVGTADIDQKYIVPLIRRLRDEHGLKVLVIERDDMPDGYVGPKLAMAVIAQAPTDRDERNRVRATILETADAFPGFAMQNWSHRWVSLDFFDEQETKGFRPKTLEKLRASQRKME